MYVVEASCLTVACTLSLGSLLHFIYRFLEKWLYSHLILTFISNLLMITQPTSQISPPFACICAVSLDNSVHFRLLISKWIELAVLYKLFHIKK
jgi:hypothetical protein